MAYWERKKSTRINKCRVCEEPIPVGEDIIYLMKTHVSPKIVNLAFHEECIYLPDGVEL